MKKSLYIAIFSIVFGGIMLFVNIPKVLAQYTTDVIKPTYEGGQETFGVNTEGEKTISVYSQGCKSIDRLVFTFKSAVNGKIQVKSHGVESPFREKKIDKIYEYCEIILENINKEDIKSIIVDAKVRRSWLTSENISEDNIGVYSYVDENWKYNKTNRDKDNSIYFYYKTDIEISNYLAVGEYIEQPVLPLGINPLLLVCCCIILLLLILLLILYYSLQKRSKEEKKA